MTRPIRITQGADAKEDGYDRVLAFLRDELMSGRLKTGDRLLPERDLASALGVSRPVIREALTALSTLGAVEIRRGYGTVVLEPNFTALADYFSLVLAQQAGAVDDVMQARIAIERQAIRLACTRALAPDLDRLAQALAGDQGHDRRPGTRRCGGLPLPLDDRGGGALPRRFPASTPPSPSCSSLPPRTQEADRQRPAGGCIPDRPSRGRAAGDPAQESRPKRMRC